MPSIAILGGGISGLSAAWKLAEASVPVTVFEAESHWGGLAGTIRQEGYSLDFGPHSFFSEDAEISEAISDLMGERLDSVSRSVKLYYNNRYLDYPFTALTILSQMGIREGFKTISSYLQTKIRKTKNFSEKSLSVEDWAISNFGPHLYEVFFKPYTEQFWKIPCSELSARTIPSHTKLSFLKTLRHLLRKRFSKDNFMQLDREKLPTAYPKTGYGEIAEVLAGKTEAAGAILKPQTRVLKLQTGGNFKIQHSEGELTSDCLISTLPLPVLISLLEDSVPEIVRKAAGALEYRPILFLGLVVPRNTVLSASYIYTLNRPYNRLTDMNRFSPATSPDGEDILALEIPCRFNDESWHKTADELFEDCINALEGDGILKRTEVKRLLLAKNRYAYPVYKKDYAAHLETVLDFIRSIPNFYTLGRSGEFRYMDADQCMRRAFDLTKRLILQWRELLEPTSAAS